MSIAKDRHDITAALEAIDWGKNVTVLPYTPALLAPYQIYLELVTLNDGSRFGSLLIHWNVVITVPAVKQLNEAEALLDDMANRCIEGLHSANAADFDNASPYIGLTEPVNNATFPAVKLTFQSTTQIKDD